jgi:hypothetical protein
MMINAEKLYKAMDLLTHDVVASLRRRGIVIPKICEDGSVKIGRFNIVKDEHGQYEIKDQEGACLHRGINLPQTAIVLANDLALGRWEDQRLIAADVKYGYADFEEHLHTHNYTKAKDRVKSGVSLAKISASRGKKTQLKKIVMDRFDKLRSLR